MQTVIKNQQMIEALMQNPNFLENAPLVRSKALVKNEGGIWIVENELLIKWIIETFELRLKADVVFRNDIKKIITTETLVKICDQSLNRFTELFEVDMVAKFAEIIVSLLTPNSSRGIVLGKIPETNQNSI